MDWSNNTSEYARWNEEDRAELRTHFEDDDSFDQVKSLLRESEKIMHQEAPTEVFNRLDRLFDETYSQPKPITKHSANFWRFSWLAAAAVVLGVLLVYPWFSRDDAPDPLARKEQKVRASKPKETEVIYKEKELQQGEEEPIIARIEDKDGYKITEDLNDEAEAVSLISEKTMDSPEFSEPTYSGVVTYPSMAQMEDSKANKSLEDDRMSNSAIKDEVYRDKFELRNDEQLAEVSMLKKNLKSKSRKIDTGAMLKNIKPVF